MAAPSPGPPASAFPTSALPSSPPRAASPAALSFWTREDDKFFESALSMHSQDMPELWEKVSAMVPGKDSGDVQRHFALLAEDVKAIEAGLVALPTYAPSSSSVSEVGADQALSARDSRIIKTEAGFTAQPSAFVASGSMNKGGDGFANNKVSLGKSEQERRKGIPWTEDEHRLFLLGLEKYGKGDWRSISRNFVISRTPTQVASHAQKYFIRLASMNKDKKRTSIHDITSVSNGDVRQKTHHPPVTGQDPLMIQPVIGQPVQLPHQNSGGLGRYVAPIGKPVTAPTGSAVGAPVLLPSPAHATSFGARPHSPKPIMPTRTVLQATYPMPQPATNH